MGMIGTKWSVKPPNASDFNLFLLAYTNLLPSPADKKKLENGKGHRSDDDDSPRRKKLVQRNGKASGSKGKR